MRYQITDGTVSLGGVTVLSHVTFEIKGSEKIAVVGRNGAGKTTLLRLIAGELELDRDDKRSGNGIVASRQLTIGMLSQQPLAFSKDAQEAASGPLKGAAGIAGGSFASPFKDAAGTAGDRSGCPPKDAQGVPGGGFRSLGERTVEEELLAACPCKDVYDEERFRYEQEYDRLFTKFGFQKSDKKKRLAEFSGGEQTKIALIRLLLMKPDLLLLDEPTNHLDLEMVQWLEDYLKRYEHAVVMVSHDRFFLDRVAEVVYEISGGRMERYVGNYTDYRREKSRRIASARRAYERQQAEIGRLEADVERFKHKPSKASFARAKRTQIERMKRFREPEEDDVRRFTGELTPAVAGSKWVYMAEHLKLGYDRPLLELSLRIRRGHKIGVIGANGVGKSTFLKTVAGLVEPLAGESRLGNRITIGYFDQHSAEIQAEESVLEHFHALFPALTEREVRSVLGRYLFGGKEAARRVSDLSGGEKARLVLAELLQSGPNFLVLDEPTNHMDMQAKETLESAFQAYTGTILFVSHDRYFVAQVAESILIFEDGRAMYDPFGYEHYLEKKRQADAGESVSTRVRAEDAALLEGIRAVPKAERRFFAEPSSEEAYADWKLRLARETLEAAGRRYGALEAECLARETEWKESERYWTEMIERGEEGAPRSDRQNGECRTGTGTPETIRGTGESGAENERERAAAWETWHACCMEWWEIHEEVS